MQAVTYRKRHNAFSRGEREWRVEDAALVSASASGAEQRWPWRDVISVRLCCSPTRLKPWRYVFELQTKSGEKVCIDNAHYVGRAAFEDRSESYTPFVRAAVARVAAANPKARALTGETKKRYFFFMLAALLGLGAVAYALIAVRTPLDSLPFAPLLKLALILAMLPIFWRWVMRAMPRGVTLDSIPERALPRCGEPSNEH